MKLPLKRALLAVVTGGMIAAPAMADNAQFAPGDLVIGFQNPGGVTGSGQHILVNLGSAALFRDATGNLLDIRNIGVELANTFGADWYEQTSLYWSAVAVDGTSGLDTTSINAVNDPNRTIYAGKARANLGTIGLAGSSTPTVGSNSLMTSGSNNVFTVGNSLDQFGTTAVGILTTGQSSLDDQNGFTNLASGLQATAYGIFPGGIQDRFETGFQFANFGNLEVEGALDLYRIQAVNAAPGQYGFGNANRTGEFQGTIVIDQDGDVSFLQAPVAPVPEPATVGFGLAMIGACAMRVRTRRRSLPIVAA